MKKILVCTNYRVNPNFPSCHARESKALVAHLSLQLVQQKINLIAEESQCLGYCAVGPNVRLIPNGRFFHHVTENSLAEIVTAAKLFSAGDS